MLPRSGMRPEETLSMTRAKDRQITFYADPDVFDWLKNQKSVTRYINNVVRTCMPSADGRTSSGEQSESPEAKRASREALNQVVGELEQIQDAILRSYKRQQAMIGALRTHQKLFEKSASFYRELGRIKDEEVIPPPQTIEVVSSYDELLVNSADSIKRMIESSEEDHQSVEKTGGIRQRLIAAIDSDDTQQRDLAPTPARTFTLNVNTDTHGS
jgi:hypothetical protein